MSENIYLTDVLYKVEDIKPGLYVTFNNSHIYQIQEGKQGLFLTLSHKVNSSGEIIEDTNEYFKDYNPLMWLIGTPTTLKLNRDRIINNVLNKSV